MASTPKHKARLLPAAQRGFAVDVVKQLRAAGFEALWAGGCVRDALLGSVPKDYDVATNATPEQVISLFGKRRTVPVGVSFGVVMVLAPQREAGEIEVATFRSDGQYLDGRRPESVEFCTAEQDALRRDFTINGMFFDPVTDTVIDFVGGRNDLQQRILRAIGNPRDRFTEDKLRMLRAIRFAATYHLQIEEATLAAVRALCAQMTQVSAERIAQELRRMLAHTARADAFAMLADSGLLEPLFPSVTANTNAEVRDQLQQVLHRLESTTFETALAVILHPLFQPTAVPRHQTAAVRAQCRQLRLSNEESDCICWLNRQFSLCRNATQMPLHVLKTTLADSRIGLLLDWIAADAIASGNPPDDAQFLRSYLTATPTDILDPPPLVSGEDLKALGIEAGPQFAELLSIIRREQLDELIGSREDALKRLAELTGPE